MTARNINLTDRLARFIEAQVAAGRHQNASEVVREALRRYEDDLAVERVSLASIRAVAEEGMTAIARGDFVAVRGKRGMRNLLRRLNRRAGDAARDSG